MARQRYVAPPREAVERGCFDAPIYAGYAHRRDWWLAPDWPSLDALNEAFGAPLHPVSHQRLRFVAQDAALLADGLHYEERIQARGGIATRPRNWHDLFNAAVWCAWPGLKAALNARQAADVTRVGPAQRTRAQCALTHFDEAGAIVVLREPALIGAWDEHDWHGLFWRAREAWRDGRAETVVIGHALLEHALVPQPLHTAKCIAVLAAPHETREQACARVRDAIADGTLLTDPQELRPLPLSGIPGWHDGGADEAFYRAAPCFRPLRPGRCYPVPLAARG